MLTSFIPARLKWLYLAVGAGLFGASSFVPGPYNLACAGVGSVALFLGGLGWRAPAWAVGKPLLPATLVPLALSAHELLSRYAHLLPEAYQGLATAAVGLLALLGGVLTPEPLKVAPGASAPAVPSPDGTVTAQVGAECSLADRIRGLC